MIQIFRPIEPKDPASEDTYWQERRKHTRYRYIAEIEICFDEGKPYLTVVTATTFEISEGGLSAATANYLNIGTKVELSPVLGTTVNAIVRRKVGAMYGFQFVELSDDARGKIRQVCEKLPLFQTATKI